MDISKNKLPFTNYNGGSNSVFTFYEGSEREFFTPFTGVNINKPVKQLLENDNNLGDRLTTVERFITSDSITSDNIVSKKMITANDLNVEGTFKSDTININKGDFTNINISNRVTSTFVKSDKLNTLDGFAKKFEIADSYVHKLKADELIMGKGGYRFKDTSIDFNGISPGITSNVIHNTTSSCGVVNNVRDKDGEIIASAKSTLNVFNGSYEYFIGYGSRNSGDVLTLGAYRLNLDCTNLNISGEISVKGGTYLGTKNNPLSKLFSSKIYGSYYTFEEADVAEVYETDKEYEPGTIIQVGLECEGEIANGTRPILGVVADKNAIALHLNTEFYNSKKFACPITLKGRIKVKITSRAKRGQYIVFDRNGLGRPCYSIDNFKDQNNLIGVVVEGGDTYCTVKV